MRYRVRVQVPAVLCFDVFVEGEESGVEAEAKTMAALLLESWSGEMYAAYEEGVRAGSLGSHEIDENDSRHARFFVDEDVILGVDPKRTMAEVEAKIVVLDYYEDEEGDDD